jgi:hypothetical protein
MKGIGSLKRGKDMLGFLAPIFGIVVTIFEFFTEHWVPILVIT